MTAFSSLEILRFFGRHGSGGLNLEMLRSGLFEEQLKLASQSNRVSEDEGVWAGLPMIKKTLPIAPPLAAPPPEVKDAPGRDEKLQHGSAQIKETPKSTSSAGRATSERPFSTRRSAQERSFRPEGNQYDQTSRSSSSPMGPDTDPLSDADSRSSDNEVVPVSGEASSAEESLGQQPSEGTEAVPSPVLEILPDDTEQIISSKKDAEKDEPRVLPAVGGKEAVAGVPETLPSNPVPQEGEQPDSSLGAGQLAVNGAINTEGIESSPASGAESGSAILSGVFPAELFGSREPGSGSDLAAGSGRSGAGGEQLGNIFLFINRAAGAGQAETAAGTPPGLLLPAGAISEPSGSAVGSSAAAAESLQAGQAEGSGRATVAGVQAGATSSGISPDRGVSSADPASGTQGAEGASQEANVQRIRFIQRVARAFQSLRDGGGSIRLRLHPPELGSLRVELLVRDGAIRARMEVENQAARTTILEHLPMLRERLAQQDIRIEQFEVEIGQEFSDTHSQQPGHSTPEHHGPGFSPSNNRTRNTNTGVPPARGNPPVASDGSKLNVVI